MSSMRCWVEHINGSRQRVPDGGLLLGRAAECTFRLVDARVAPHHTRVDLLRERAILNPCKGASTLLNGVPQTGSRPLRDGDWISLAPGLLFRVILQDADAQPPWCISGEGGEIRLDAIQREATPLSGIRLLWTPDRLLMETTVPTLLNGVTLVADGRSWALDVGDEVRVDGQCWRVTSGRVPWAPRVWTAQPALLHKAAGGVTLWPGVCLVLHYPHTDASVALGADTAALAAALVEARGESIDPDLSGGAAAVRALREALIGAGVDGFSLLASTAGGIRVRLALIPSALIQISSQPPPRLSRSLRQCWWMEVDDGSCQQVDSGGLLLGRHEECDFRVTSPHIHRHHALVRLRRQGIVEVAPLGRHPTYRNMLPLEGSSPLADGEEIRLVSDHILRLRSHACPTAPTPTYTLQRGDVLLPIGCPEVWLGGTALGSLPLPGWPPNAARLIRLPAALFCLPTVPLLVGDHLVLPGHARRLQVGDTLRLEPRAGEPSVSLSVAAITLDPDPPRLHHLVAQTIPRAGRVLARLSDGTQLRICLIGRRFQLIALLLEAAISSRLRGFIRTQSPSLDSDTDENLLHGAMHFRDIRLELTQQQRLTTAAVQDLVRICRAELIAAGLDGESLLEMGDDWVRIVLSPACNVDLYR